MTRPEELLDAVHDRETFIAFVRCLADDRSAAQKVEADNPIGYIVDGAMGWANGDIPDYLYGCLEYFTDGPLRDPPVSEPSWRAFADFLYCDKIIE